MNMGIMKRKRALRQHYNLKKMCCPFNDAVFDDVMFIYLPEETAVEVPIHILNIFTNAKKHFMLRLDYFVGEMYSGYYY